MAKKLPSCCPQPDNISQTVKYQLKVPNTWSSTTQQQQNQAELYRSLQVNEKPTHNQSKRSKKTHKQIKQIQPNELPQQMKFCRTIGDIVICKIITFARHVHTNLSRLFPLQQCVASISIVAAAISVDY